MPLRTFLAWLRRKEQFEAGHKPRRTQPRWRSALLLERLEDRVAPAALLLVNSALDSDSRDAVLTLREAIEVSNRTLAVSSLTTQEQFQVSGTPTAEDTDTIAFSIPGGGVHTVSLTSGLPTISDPVLLDG